MSSIKGTKTEQNLLKAFAGESQARTRYTFFASVAKKEGYEQISAIFMETAEQEKEHAKKFFKFLEGGMVEITASYPVIKHRKRNRVLRQRRNRMAMPQLRICVPWQKSARSMSRMRSPASFLRTQEK